MPKNNKDSYIIFAVLLVVFVLLVGSLRGAKSDVEAETLGAVEISDPIESLDITAEAYSIYDAHEGVFLEEKNSDEVRPIASITKIMTAIIVAENLDPNALVEITNEDVSAEGNSHVKAGESFTVRDLLNHALIASSNDSIAAISNYFETVTEKNIVEEMNIRTQSLGLKSTYFYNPSGLDTGTYTAGAYSTAKEVSLLNAYFYSHFPEYAGVSRVLETSITTKDGGVIQSINTNSHVQDTPGLVQSKTGYTDLAGGNLTVVIDKGIGHPIVITVLGSTYENRYTDVIALAEYILKSND